MTETYELFRKWWKTLPRGAKQYLDPDNTNVGLAAFEAGHAAGRMEERAEQEKRIEAVYVAWSEDVGEKKERLQALMEKRRA